jgi:formate dehydrogenase major subunit
VDLKARVTTDVKSGVLSSTFHFPEINLNVIGSDECDSEAMCPEYKVVAVAIRKSKGLKKEKV